MLREAESAVIDVSMIIDSLVFLLTFFLFKVDDPINRYVP